MAKVRLTQSGIYIGHAARLLGVSVETLRNWEKSKKLVPVKTATGRRVYTPEQINDLRAEKTDTTITVHDVPVGPLREKFQHLLDGLDNNDTIQLEFRKTANFNMGVMCVEKFKLVNGLEIISHAHVSAIPVNEAAHCRSLGMVPPVTELD